MFQRNSHIHTIENSQITSWNRDEHTIVTVSSIMSIVIFITIKEANDDLIQFVRRWTKATTYRGTQVIFLIVEMLSIIHVDDSEYYDVS